MHPSGLEAVEVLGCLLLDVLLFWRLLLFGGCCCLEALFGGVVLAVRAHLRHCQLKCVARTVKLSNFPLSLSVSLSLYVYVCTSVCVCVCVCVCLSLSLSVSLSVSL